MTSPSPPSSTSINHDIQNEGENDSIQCFICRKVLSDSEKESRNSFSPDSYDKAFQKVLRLVNRLRKPKDRRTTSWNSDQIGYFCSICRSFAFQLYDLSQSLTNHKRASGQYEVKRLENAIKDLELRIMFKISGTQLTKGYNFDEKAENCFQNDDVVGFWDNKFMESMFGKHLKNPKKISQLKAKFGMSQNEPDLPNQKDSSFISSLTEETSNQTLVETTAETPDEQQSEINTSINHGLKVPEWIICTPVNEEEAQQSAPVTVQEPEVRHRPRKQLIISRVHIKNSSKAKGNENPLRLGEHLNNKPVEEEQGAQIGTFDIGVESRKNDSEIKSTFASPEPALGDTSPSKTTEKESEIFICDKCNKSFSSRSSLNGHVWIHRKPYCALCRQFFINSDDLDSHNSDAHPANGEHFCYICQKKFDKPPKLVIHLRSHKDINSYSCAAVNCVETFKMKLECVRHMKACPLVPKLPKRRRQRQRKPNLGLPKRVPTVATLAMNANEMDLIEFTPTEADNEMPYYLMEYSEDYGMEIEEAEPFA